MPLASIIILAAIIAAFVTFAVVLACGDYFSSEFRKSSRAAGVPGSAHGMRKIAATRAAENGATVAELEAMFGRHGGGMASHDAREADRVRLAKDAMHKLASDRRTPIPAPLPQVRASLKKQQ